MKKESFEAQNKQNAKLEETEIRRAIGLAEAYDIKRIREAPIH